MLRWRNKISAQMISEGEAQGKAQRAVPLRSAQGFRLLGFRHPRRSLTCVRDDIEGLLRKKRRTTAVIRPTGDIPSLRHRARLRCTFTAGTKRSSLRRTAPIRSFETATHWRSSLSCLKRHAGVRVQPIHLHLVAGPRRTPSPYRRSMPPSSTSVPHSPSSNHCVP